MAISKSYVYACDLCEAKIESPYGDLPGGWLKVWLTKGDLSPRVWCKISICSEHNMWNRMFGRKKK